MPNEACNFLSSSLELIREWDCFLGIRLEGQIAGLGFFKDSQSVDSGSFPLSKERLDLTPIPIRNDRRRI